MCVCVFFTLNRRVLAIDILHTHLSALIRHPREIPALWLVTNCEREKKHRMRNVLSTRTNAGHSQARQIAQMCGWMHTFKPLYIHIQDAPTPSRASVRLGTDGSQPAIKFVRSGFVAVG